MKRQMIIVSLVGACLLLGCSPYTEEGLAPQNQIKAPVPEQKKMALKVDADRCLGDDSCLSGRCSDPGFGFKICTSECSFSRPCQTGLSCVHGLCIPSCSSNDDCKAHLNLPICAGGGVCWKAE